MDSSSYPSIARIRATVKRYVADCLRSEYIDKLFSGVMGLEDFADYVTYEACTAQYIKNEKRYALFHHVNNVYHSHLDYQANSNHQSGKIKNDPGFSPKSLYKGLHTYLKDMVDRRASDLEASGLTGTSTKKVPLNFLDLLYYESKEANKQREVFPLTTSYYLQVYTSYVLGIKSEKFLKRLSNKNFGIPEAESYYELQDTFTPEAILPHLPWAPRPYSSKILHMPRNYSYIVPHFFANEDELLKCINEDTSNKKWLIFMPHISDARRFNKGLSHPYCMLNGEEREANPDKWYKVLENEWFEEKVCLVTAIIDAGVNFKDPALVNIAIFSTNPNTYKQVLGRKRRSSSDEKVHLYAWCPMPEEINKLKFRNTAMREAIDSFEERKAQFIQKYILQPQEFDLRSLMAVSPEGEMEPNHLARIYLQNEFDLFEKIQLYAKEHKDPACFDVFVTRWLGIPLPDRADSWLDGRFSGEARLKFDSFLNEYFGVILDEEGFLEFSKEFQHKCINAYGKASNGRDRDDRIWKEKKINNKFEELDLPYKIDCNNLDKTYCLLKRKVV